MILCSVFQRIRFHLNPALYVSSGSSISLRRCQLQKQIKTLAAAHKIILPYRNTDQIKTKICSVNAEIYGTDPLIPFGEANFITYFIR